MLTNKQIWASSDLMMRNICPLILFVLFVLVQFESVHSRVKYIWPSTTAKEKVTVKNVTTTSKKSAKVKVKSLRLEYDSKKNTQSENKMANSNAKGIINTKNSKGEEPEGVAQRKINNDVQSDKVKNAAECMDNNGRIKKEGEEWHEKEECNSCSCICRPNGKQNCFCTRMGC